MALPKAFIPNPMFQELYEATEEGKDKLVEAAESVKPIAQGMAPTGTGFRWAKGRGLTPEGHYKDKFVVVEEDGEIRLGNTDWKAHWIEYGTVDTPIFAVIRRATESAGYRLG